MMENGKLLSGSFVFGWVARPADQTSVHKDLYYMSSFCQEDYFSDVKSSLAVLRVMAQLQITRIQKKKRMKRHDNKRRNQIWNVLQPTKRSKKMMIQSWLHLGSAKETTMMKMTQMDVLDLRKQRRKRKKERLQNQTSQKDQERVREKRPQESQTWKETCWEIVWVWWTYKYWIRFQWIWKGFSGWSHCRHAGRCFPSCTRSWKECKLCAGGTLKFSCWRFLVPNSLRQASESAFPAAKTSNQCSTLNFESPAQNVRLSFEFLICLASVRLNCIWFILIPCKLLLNVTFRLVDFC